jgi:hypothetical protein
MSDISRLMHWLLKQEFLLRLLASAVKGIIACLFLGGKAQMLPETLDRCVTSGVFTLLPPNAFQAHESSSRRLTAILQFLRRAPTVTREL